MRLKPDQLSSHLNKKKLAPIYIISGDEPLLIQEASDETRLVAKNLGFTERVAFDVDAKFDWQQLNNATQNLSLFSERKLLELRIPSGKPGDSGSKQLQQYIASLADQPNPDQLLLIILPKIDAATQKTKWFKAIEQIGVFIQVWPIDRQHLPQWIHQRFQAAGLTANRDAVHLLAERVEGNLLAAKQEIEKLSLIMPQGARINAETIVQSVTDNTRFNIFKLTDSMLAGNTKRSYKLLQALKETATEPTVILWGLTREIRQLLTIIEAEKHGQSRQQSFKAHRIWPQRQSLVQNALRRLSYEKLMILLKQTASIDKVIKGAKNANLWNELTDLVVVFSGATVTIQPKIA